MSQSRREFLLRTGCGALGLAASQAAIEKLGLISAIARPLGPSDYRALVCVFLDGGNDGSNMIIPADTAGYGAYAAARSGSALTIPRSGLLTITPRTINRPFGLHPALPELQSLWNQQKQIGRAHV